jgi:hypothetical protein
MLSWMKPAFLAAVLYVRAGSAAAAIQPNVIIDYLGYGLKDTYRPRSRSAMTRELVSRRTAK